jgi:hypothetical protein
MWISWKHKDTDFTHPLTFDQKVDLFYEQTLGWQLHIADLVTNGGTTFPREGVSYPVVAIDHSGFAVLHICLSYFELVGSIVLPNKLSDTETFKAGARRAFPRVFTDSSDSENALNRLHKGARCGLYHTGRTRQGVGLGGPTDGSSIGYDSRSDQVVVDPKLLPKALKAHLDKFRLELLDSANDDLRRQFERRFDRGFE